MQLIPEDDIGVCLVVWHRDPAPQRAHQDRVCVRAVGGVPVDGLVDHIEHHAPISTACHDTSRHPQCANVQLS